MKTTLLKLGLLIAVLLASLTASAYDFEVDGIYYNVVSLTDLTCELTYGDVEYSGDIQIPSEVKYNNKTLSIVDIDNYAFGECSSLTAVTIPNSVTEIGYRAFYKCSSLTSVTIPDSVTAIGNYAFEGCSSLTAVTIPDSILYIPDGAFESCSSLTAVTIPNSVTEIGYRAFSYCKSLTSVTIPNSVTAIGNYAFPYCESLTSVTIPDSVTYIGSSAFSGCSSLISVTIPDSVTKINECTFANCSSLVTIELGNSVEYLNGAVFENCTNLKSITFPGSVNYVKWRDGWGGLFFSGCNSLREIRFLYGGTVLNVEYLISNSKTDVSLPIDHLYIDRRIIWGYRTAECVKQIKQLSFGPNMSNITLPDNCYFQDLKDLETIYCYSLEPPTIGEFSNAQYINVVVKVPYEALEAYQQADVWKNFWNLEGFDPSGVEDVKEEPIRKREIGRYDLNGRPISEDFEGISIIRYSDGSTKKMIGK